MAASRCCNAALYFLFYIYTQVRATRGGAHAHKKCFANPIGITKNSSIIIIIN